MQKKNLLNESSTGYWQKPQLAKLLAFGYLAFPAIFWWQMRQTSAGITNDMMSPLVFTQELFCAVTAAIALLWVTKPSLFYLVFLSAYFLGFKVYQFSNSSLDTPLEVAGMMFWFAAPATLLASQARLAYLEPQRRWWKRPERYVHPTGAQVLSRGAKFPLVVMNVSACGAFVKLDERIFHEVVEGQDEKRRDGAGRFPSVTSAERLIALRNMHEYPKLGEVVSIAIETQAGMDSPFPKNRFVTLAEVVWVTKVTDPYQYGLGLKFTGMSFRDRSRLRRYLKLLPPDKL